MGFKGFSILAAKAEGRHFEGISDLGGSLYGGARPECTVCL